MMFNHHEELRGKHATLSPSKYYWVDYTPERLREYFGRLHAVEEGIDTHDFARRCIERGVKLPKRKKTLNMYVNDSINLGLTPEQVLYYSSDCFGTADAIGFQDGVLYIFDLKTGTSSADMRQLLIYAALFCMEYPREWSAVSEVVLRIYQNKTFREERPTKEKVVDVAKRICEANIMLTEYDLDIKHYE